MQKTLSIRIDEEDYDFVKEVAKENRECFKNHAGAC